ncbi:MAG: hypothetical protein AAF183_06415 [Pseudomonadota bacterium]
MALLMLVEHPVEGVLEIGFGVCAVELGAAVQRGHVSSIDRAVGPWK